MEKKTVEKELEERQKDLPENLRVKFFDLNKGKFNINGKVYYYQPQLKTRRQLKFDQLSVVVGFTANFEYIAGMLQSIHRALTSSDNVPQALINAATITYEGLQVITDKKRFDSDELVPYVYQLASLILVTEDEDTTQMSDVIMKKKYEDFKNSDYSYHAFFLLALNHIAKFADIYEEIKSMREDANDLLDLKR